MTPFKITDIVKIERWDSKTLKKLRRTGIIPAQIYGKNLNNTYFGIPEKVMSKILNLQNFTIFSIPLNGQEYLAHLQELQRDPVSNKVILADFVLLRDDKKYVITVPIKLVGTPIGTLKGGTVLQNMKYIRLKCLPSQFLEYYEVDISHLDLGQRLHIYDLIVKEKTRTILHPAHLLVARIPGAIPKQKEQQPSQATTTEEKK